MMGLTSLRAGMWRTLSLCFIFVQASSIPTSMLTLTLHSQPKSWNEARWICEYNAGALFSAQNSSRQALLESLMQDAPLSSFASQNVYLGLHNPSGDKTADAYVWSDCSPLAYSKWASSHPQALFSKFCASLGSSLRWESEYCTKAHPFLCQRVGGACTYDTISNKKVVDTNPLVRQPTTLQECQSECDVDTSDGMECWALSFLSTSQACLLHFGSDVTYLKNDSNLLYDVTSTLYIKNCIKVLVDNASYAEVTHASTQAFSPCYAPFPNLTATTYTLFQSPTTWFEANATCARLGQKLYQPRTANITFDLEMGFNFSTSVWLGLQSSTGADYKWIDGDLPVGYTLWAVGSPSSSTGCAYRQLASGKWATDICNATRPFMCERSKGQCFFEDLKETRGTVYEDHGYNLACYKLCDFLTDCVGYSFKLFWAVSCHVHINTNRAFLYNPANFQTGQEYWTMYRPRCTYVVVFPGVPRAPEDFPLVEGTEVDMSSLLASQNTLDMASASPLTSQALLSTGEATTMQSSDQTTFSPTTSPGIQPLPSSSQSLAGPPSSQAFMSMAPSIMPTPVPTQVSSLELRLTYSSGGAPSSHTLSDYSPSPMSDAPISPTVTAGPATHSASAFHSTTGSEDLSSSPFLHQSIALVTSLATLQGTNVAAQSSFPRTNALPTICSCRCSASLAVQPSVLSSLVSDLIVPKNSTRRSQSKLVSAPDHRPSAKGMGYVAIVVLVLVVALLIVPDLLHVARKLCK